MGQRLPVGSIGGNPLISPPFGFASTGEFVVDNIELAQTGNVVPTPVQERPIWQADFDQTFPNSGSYGFHFRDGNDGATGSVATNLTAGVGGSADTEYAIDLSSWSSSPPVVYSGFGVGFPQTMLRMEPLNRSAAFTPLQCETLLHDRKLKRRERRAPTTGGGTNCTGALGCAATICYSGAAVKHENEVPRDDTTAGTRRKIIILVLMIAVVGGLLFCILRPCEPSYQGKSLSGWIRGLEYENVNPTDEQRAALRAMGEPAVTRLISILQSRDSVIKRKFVAYAQHHADIHNRFIAPRHVIPEDVYHSEAATALGEIGPAAQAAIPALTTASTNNYFLVAARAKAALIKIRQESITSLLVLLEDTKSTNWNRAARTVKYLGTNGEAAVPLLINALQSTNDGVRQTAVMGLAGIASRPELAIPALIDCLQDKSPYIRRGAVDALCQFKSAKQQIVPLFLSRLDDADNNVWLGAAFGLEGLLDEDEKRTEYVPALIKCLDNPAEIIRINAATFLKRNDPKAAAKAGVK